MSDQGRDEAIKAMVRRAVSEVDGLKWSNDYDLIATLMTVIFESGQRDRLETFAGDRQTRLFGVIRARYHYAGVGKVWQGFSQGYACIMVQTTGTFGGIWFFALDGDYSILTSHNGEGVETFAGLEGVELIRAVISSALTTEIQPDPPSAPGLRSRLPRWLGGSK